MYYPTITPDWVEVGTKKEVESFFGPPFEFLGPGWYLFGDDTSFLIMPVEVPNGTLIFKQTWPEETKFYCYFFSNSPGKLFGEIATAPVRVSP